ncbi:ABC transporter permease [Stutzerimonas kirkiae]|uniref:ABC transporter permease n=1 Tax=Stutzerimonas kirkiae TaxID=2211392 RepID=UPI001038339A|nr:ABC transporter permease [Stutzerimonas kirkiae]TBV08853.1 D,D-dipeptide ABC transporter permease [Stutzerimonas kirkiae]
MASESIAQSIWQARRRQAALGLRRFSGNRSALAGSLILLALLLVALLAPWLAPGDYNAQDLGRTLLAPSAQYWLGTDELGRDILARLIHGTRLTLYIAVLCALIVAPVGLLVGVAAGYFGGWTDRVLMRVVDVFLAFPGLILALAFSAALGPGIENAVLAISLAAWPPIARLARAETLSIRNADYISAARLLGASHLRLIVRHIMPLCLPSVVVRVTLNMAAIVLAAAGLGFLGLGAQPPSPEWGAMLASGREYGLTAWWVAAAPGCAILLASLAFNLFGDGLRDALDPRHD